MKDYVYVKDLIEEIEKNYNIYDVYGSYGMLDVIEYLHDSYGYDGDLQDIIYALGQAFISEMTDLSPLIIRIAMLKDIYESGGCYIHKDLKNFIKDSEKNPLCHWRACQNSYKESFQKVISTFFNEFALTAPKEELVLDEEKQPLTWWKNKIELCLKGGE